MAELRIIDPISGKIKTLRETYVTFSGIITVDGNPARRVVKVMSQDVYGFFTKGATLSDKNTGEWSITILGTTVDKHFVMCFGEVGEKSEVYDKVVGG